MVSAYIVIELNGEKFLKIKRVKKFNADFVSRPCEFPIIKTLKHGFVLSEIKIVTSIWDAALSSNMAY